MRGRSKKHEPDDNGSVYAMLCDMTKEERLRMLVRICQLIKERRIESPKERRKRVEAARKLLATPVDKRKHAG